MNINDLKFALQDQNLQAGFATQMIIDVDKNSTNVCIYLFPLKNKSSTTQNYKCFSRKRCSFMFIYCTMQSSDSVKEKLFQ